MNPNINCLAGMACPSCKNFGPFKIEVTISSMTEVTDNGTDMVIGVTADAIWSDLSKCSCPVCGLEGIVRNFNGNPELSFDNNQHLVDVTYNGGNHECDSPDEINTCGDALLTFMMNELSEKEGCIGYVEAKNRLTRAIHTLHFMCDVFEAV